MARWHKETCPKCGGNNFGITSDNGTSYCFNCTYLLKDDTATYKPRVRSDHKDEIRNFYNQAAHYYHSSLDTKARKYLLSRGFTDHTIDLFKIGYCPLGKNPMYRNPIAVEAGLANRSGTGFLADRITFPYFYDEHTITDIRGRSLNPADEVRYLSPFGDSFYRWADYPYNYHLRCNNRIIITEGEIKASIATQLAYPTMGLPGILTWRDGFEPDPKTTYIIIFDSQRNHMQNVRMAIIRIADKLPNPLIGTLPLFGEDKQDIDTLILQYGADMFKDVVDMALPYEEWKELQRF